MKFVVNLKHSACLIIETFSKRHYRLCMYITIHVYLYIVIPLESWTLYKRWYIKGVGLPECLTRRISNLRIASRMTSNPDRVVSCYILEQET